MSVEHYVSIEEVRHALRSLYGSGPETNLQAVLSRALADPLRPTDAKGRWKPNPFLILLFIIACALAGVFLYFSVGGSQ
jgi:hypothetical protein